ncbi:hypothetical protein E3E31_03860 [Thermococcus sp. M39]|nr:hypothetical protein [Thermococcus sp. M39]
MENVITFAGILNSIKPGETVLIEHTSNTAPYLALSLLVTWARENGYPVVVDDILDTYPLYFAHM